MEVGVEERTIKCIVGSASLARLPRVLWECEGVGEWKGTRGRGGGASIVRIVPVLFTQGIDIQQSMSHASSTAKEKAAFQVRFSGGVVKGNMALRVLSEAFGDGVDWRLERGGQRVCRNVIGRLL